MLDRDFVFGLSQFANPCFVEFGTFESIGLALCFAGMTRTRNRLRWAVLLQHKVRSDSSTKWPR
ncbi:hypothetical protein, partial [Paraburkholderia sp. J63]|uniref:hypothetical protein n=1 Tax=Paraburkholderia sp. J63 TaxID=2805434 RepID=UPI002ABDAF58